MKTLWILNVVVWTAMVVYMAPGAWAAVRGTRTRRGNPMRLGCFITGLVVIGFNLRWLIAPGNIAVWEGLSVFAILDACLIIALARAYGRGGLVS